MCDKKVSVEQAAARMGVPPQFLRMGLRAARFPFGTAVLMPGGQWSYYISARRLEMYLNGEDMVLAMERKVSPLEQRTATGVRVRGTAGADGSD